LDFGRPGWSPIGVLSLFPSRTNARYRRAIEKREPVVLDELLEKQRTRNAEPERSASDTLVNLGNGW
jgi:hypothetical protein